MVSLMFDKLPMWSKTIDPKQQLSYTELVPTAMAFLALPASQRLDLIKQYHEKYCLPQFDLERASAIYLFFRVIFKLPDQQLRTSAKVFGGWLHPSIGTTEPYFNLSWPTKFDARNSKLPIDRFTGYSGKGYDALGEYKYFASLFPFRESSELEKLVVDWV